MSFTSPRLVMFALALIAVLGGFATTACGSDDDGGGVEVIGQTPGAEPDPEADPDPEPNTTAEPAAGEGYTPVSDVDAHAALALDVRDIAALLAPAAQGEAVDWTAVSDLYEGGKNSLRGDGTPRTLASIARDETVSAQFPDGAAVYGNASFLDAHVRAGIDGTGRGAGLSDGARRQLVEKGISAILYGKVLQELDAARGKLEQGETGDADGAPHNVDEAWAFYAGSRGDNGTRPFALSSTARKREADFGFEGKIDAPLQAALADAQSAARSGDLAAFDAAAAEVEGYLNAMFYLASLKYVKSAAGDAEAASRESHLAEGWAFFQTIRAAAAAGGADSASDVESVYSQNAEEPVSSDQINVVYAALNAEPVLNSLGVPQELRVIEPPA